jgi:hypothetical protein
MTPWHLMEAHEALKLFHGLRARYPARALFPFAARQNNDDVACWAERMGEKVFVIHDFATPGDEDEEFYDDVWSWFRAAIEETIEWE